MSDIKNITATAYSAFVAVRIDSHDLVNQRQPAGSKLITSTGGDDHITYSTDAEGNLVPNVKAPSTSATPTTATSPSSAHVIIPHVEIHTGNWGTGAYGGNRVLMAALQLLAARLARTDTFVYHTVDAINTTAYQHAARLLDYLVPSRMCL
jgi:hypothetical protein